jgi:hypothetical protein
MSGINLEEQMKQPKIARAQELVNILKKTTNDQKLLKRKADFLLPLLSTKSKRKAFIQKVG